MVILQFAMLNYQGVGVQAFSSSKLFEATPLEEACHMIL
jgi:hypothetical protein